MTTPMPASPFLSASDGLHPLSSVAVTLGAGPTALESVTAEIQSSPDVLLNLSEIEPSATLVFASGDTPAVIVPSRGLVAADRIDGAIPLDYETILKALESCLHEDWIFGIDEPDPLVFLETFPLNARVA